MKKLLLVIDYQNDFVADDGLLTCGKMAQDIEDNILAAINLYEKDTIYFTKDTHTSKGWAGHPESKIFPLHCVLFSKGHELYNRVYDKSSRRYCMNKATYALDHSHIYNMIKEFDEIVLCGVATNICVLQNAIALYNASVSYGFTPNFKVIENACASFDKNEHDRAIAYMKNTLGFEVV